MIASAVWRELSPARNHGAFIPFLKALKGPYCFTEYGIGQNRSPDRFSQGGNSNHTRSEMLQRPIDGRVPNELRYNGKEGHKEVGTWLVSRKRGPQAKEIATTPIETPANSLSNGRLSLGIQMSPEPSDIPMGNRIKKAPTHSRTLNGFSGALPQAHG